VIADFDRGVRDWNDDYEQLRKAWDESVDEANRRAANDELKGSLLCRITGRAAVVDAAGRQT